MKLSDLILLSDVDGTLLPSNSDIPPRNLEALRRFTQQGGRFGLATGRSRRWVDEMAQVLPVNAPCVLFNGGLLYDYATGEKIMELLLPDAARDYLQEITSTVPNLSALVVTDDEYYNVHDEKKLAFFVKTREADSRPRMDWREITAPWYKILFLVLEEAFDPFFDYVNERAFPGVRFVATNPTLIEMLPEGSSKGAALEALMARRGVRREQLVTIGDFYNDLEMIRLAGTGVTLCDSPEDIRAQADLVVGPCAHGALADLVEHLEKRYT